MGLVVINWLGWFSLGLVCLGVLSVLGVGVFKLFMGLRELWKHRDYGLAIFWSGVGLTIIGLALLLMLSMLVRVVPKG